MTKPFDTQDLMEKAKAAGLPMLEKDVKIMTDVLFAWLQESLILEAATNPVFAIGVPVLQALKPAVFAAEDKIDGVQGNIGA